MRTADRVVGASVVGLVAAVAIAAGAGASSQQEAQEQADQGPRTLRAQMASKWKTRQPAQFGFSDSGPGFLKAAPAAAYARSTVARFAISWTNIWEHGWGNLDDVVAVLRENGITPLLTVSDSPPWANPDALRNGRFHIVAPLHRYDADFAQFYAALAMRYPDAILQVWSEPNLEFYGQIPPDRYVELANLAADTVHAINPGQLVLGAATSPGDAAWRQYTRAIYASLDREIGVAANLYPRKGRSLRLAARRLSKDFRRVKKVARGRPIWITETGLAAIQFGLRRQAKGSAQIYKILAGGGAKGIIFHRLIDPDRPINEWEDTLGALTIDQRQKPLFKRLRSLRMRHLRGP